MMKLYSLLVFLACSTSSSAVVQAIINTTIIPIVDLELPVAHGIQKIFASFDDAGDISLNDLQFVTTNNAQYPDHETVIDIVVLKVPEECRRNNGNINNNFATCDWSTLAGIGVATRRTESGLTSWYCCTKDARADKACSAEQYGHLILDAVKFKGEKRSINITSTSAATPTTFDSSMAAGGQDADPWFFADDAGDYAILLANCHAKSKTVKVNGSVTVESFEMKRTMAQVSVFHILLAICYICLMAYFYQLMQLNKASRIMLEEWIMMVIVLGFVEIALRAMEYHIWASSGDPADGLAFIAMIFGAAKHALGRCLILLLSLGWGVVRDSLVIKTLGAVLFVSMALFLVSIALDVLIFYISTRIYSDSDDNEGHDKRINSIFMSLFKLQVFIEAIFMIWIPCALCNTMKYLRSTDQHAQKLARYRTLLRIVVGGTMLTGLTVVIMMTGAIPGISFRTVTETNQINFFIILTFVAMVWKPNPYAREYAYSSLMDLSLEGGDDVDHAHHRNAANNSQSTLYMELTDSTPDVAVQQHYAHQQQQQNQQQQSWMIQPQQQQQQQQQHHHHQFS